MSICYIYGAGDHFGAPTVPAHGDLVIAADGGLVYLERHGLAPDLLVGDFDSLSMPPRPGLDVVTLPSVKDDTDMVAALREGWERDFRIFHIHGGTGGRLDHTLANIQCVADLAVRGARGYLFGADTVTTAIANGGIRLGALAKGYVSVFSHSDSCAGVNLRGLKYELRDARLSSLFPLGVSNEFTGEPAEISVREGTLVVVYPRIAREESCFFA